MGQARIFGQSAAGGGASGKLINVAYGAELPTSVVNDQVFIVTDTTPGTVYFDTNEPENPANGDIWVVIAESDHALTLTNKSPFLDIGLIAAKKYTDAAWAVVSAFLGKDGEWAELEKPVPPVGTALNSCTWEEINIISSKGLAADYWQIGDTKEVMINSEQHTVEIVGFNHDPLADGSRMAGITFGMKNCLGTKYRIHNSNATVTWENCNFRSTLQDTIFKSLTSDLQTVIKSVNKKYRNANICVDTLFLFSKKELTGSANTSNHNDGDQYPRFSANAARVKNIGGSAAEWWTRTSEPAGPAGAWLNIDTSGASAGGYVSDYKGIAFGFCV